MANYEAKLRQEGSVSPIPNATAGANILRGTGHGRVAQSAAEGICHPLPIREPASPWALHQERTHKLSAYAKQQPIGHHYVGKGTLHVSAQSFPHYDETSDDNYQLGLGVLPCGGEREPGLAHPGMARGGTEQLFHRDWYETSARPMPAPLPRQEEYAWHAGKASKEMLT